MTRTITIDLRIDCPLCGPDWDGDSLPCRNDIVSTTRQRQNHQVLKKMMALGENYPGKWFTAHQVHWIEGGGLLSAFSASLAIRTILHHHQTDAAVVRALTGLRAKGVVERQRRGQAGGFSGPMEFRLKVISP